jgi:hypothetical protein
VILNLEKSTENTALFFNTIVVKQKQISTDCRKKSTMTENEMFFILPILLLFFESTRKLFGLKSIRARVKWQTRTYIAQNKRPRLDDLFLYF